MYDPHTAVVQRLGLAYLAQGQDRGPLTNVNLVGVGIATVVSGCGSLYRAWKAVKQVAAVGTPAKSRDRPGGI